MRPRPATPLPRNVATPPPTQEDRQSTHNRHPASSDRKPTPHHTSHAPISKVNPREGSQNAHFRGPGETSHPSLQELALGGPPVLAPVPAARVGALIGYARVSTNGQLLDR
ncbi:hypothetical protein GCM10010319_23880 [Streptomyces blastmyceticus]|uniref:Resolvase/invertase-type recombinase catalytic domain-containing protein n=1 Tax=Streptomyces blastmyceticus TaxID=68180 RepID=A0ABP3GJ84_9ACTN